MGCGFWCESCCVDEIIGKLTGYNYHYDRVTVFLNNKSSSSLRLMKSDSNYDTTLEKLKRLEGKPVSIKALDSIYILDVDEYFGASYTGKIKHIIGLSKNTEESPYFEIIFETLKYDHIFVMDNEFYEAHTEMLEVGSEYKIYYELLDNKYYKVVKIEKYGENKKEYMLL